MEAHLRSAILRDIATEPAHIIIRLYSKTAEHDEGGRAQILGGSYGSNMQNLSYFKIVHVSNHFTFYIV